MEPKNDDKPEGNLLDTFRKSWFAPVTALGAFSAIVAAAFRIRPEPPVQARPAGKPDTLTQIQPAAPERRFELEYTQVAVLGSPSAPPEFKRSLSGIAIGPGNALYALGDDEIRVFNSNGSFARGFRAPGKAACLAVGPDGKIYVGTGDLVDIHDPSGQMSGGFQAGEKGKPAEITAIKVFGKEILVADAAARYIRRYDAAGKQLGVIGTQNKTGNFILPNRFLDIDVDPQGIVFATDTGRHKVTFWAMDGTPKFAFGKFGMTNPEDFVGCCNPVNIAIAPGGRIVTGEKMVARVKVYDMGGKLLAVIGPNHFDPACTHLHLAVDSKGRIAAADPVRRVIKIFAPADRSGVAEASAEELKQA